MLPILEKKILIGHMASLLQGQLIENHDVTQRECVEVSEILLRLIDKRYKDA